MKSRVTSHAGGIISCNVLGACRITVEDSVFTDIMHGTIVHMCTGHGLAVRRSTISKFVQASVLECPVAVAKASSNTSDRSVRCGAVKSSFRL